MCSQPHDPYWNCALSSINVSASIGSVEVKDAVKGMLTVNLELAVTSQDFLGGLVALVKRSVLYGSKNR
jgi:hypothetical protein